MQDQSPEASPEAMSSPPLPPREPRQTPTLLSRLLNPTILLLTSLTLAFSISYAVLAADILAYALAETRDSNYYMVEVQPWWERGEAGRQVFRGVMEYAPELLELGGLKAVMAVGMLAAVGSLVVVVLWVLRLWSTQGREEDQDGVVKPKLTWIPTATLAISTLTFLLTLITTIATRSFASDAQAPHAVIYPEYFSPLLSGTWNESSPAFALSTYESPVPSNPVAWNCQVTRVLAYTYPAGDVRRLCREGAVVWPLMVPGLVLQGVVVGLLGLVVVREWRARRAARVQVQ